MNVVLLIGVCWVVEREGIVDLFVDLCKCEFVER